MIIADTANIQEKAQSGSDSILWLLTDSKA